MPVEAERDRSNEPASSPAQGSLETSSAFVAQSSDLTDAGFLAGLSVVIEALQPAAMIVDRTGFVVAANRAARRFLPRLGAPSIRSFLASVAQGAAQCSPPAKARLDLAGKANDDFDVAPLTSSSAVERGLVLLTMSSASALAREQKGPDVQKGDPSLIDYEVGRVPTRQLREEAARFKRLSETDPLTGVLNLRAFVARVTQALSDRPGRRGAMIFLDLNGFKEINDAYGHATGDRVLAHVADKLTFPPHTWIATARIGGDEFAMWMPGVLPENLENVIAGIRARLCVPVDVSDTSSDRLRIMATAAIGAACCPDEARSYEALRNLADKRMYQDKAQIRAAQSPFGTLK